MSVTGGTCNDQGIYVMNKYLLVTITDLPVFISTVQSIYKLLLVAV